MIKKQAFYTAKFKAEVIKAIEEKNGNILETVKQLGISIQILSNWQSKI